MISVEAAKYLWDAHKAADSVARFTAGKTLTDFLADDLLRAGVERQFEIIGEAFSRLRNVDPKLAGDIPDLAQGES